MREVLIAVGLFLIVALVGSALVLPPEDLISLGEVVMLAGAAVGVPLFVIYYAALGLILRRAGVAPEGWYWRSFAHHHLLVGGERWVVLPWFWVGMVGFIASFLGIATVILGVIAAAVHFAR